MKKEKFDIQGMTCSSCSAHVEKAVKKVDGVKSVIVNLLSNNMVVEYDEKVRRSKHTPAVEKHDIFPEYVFLRAEHSFLSGEYDFPDEELEFLLWRFSITALLLDLDTEDAVNLKLRPESSSHPTKPSRARNKNDTALGVQTY